MVLVRNTGKTTFDNVSRELLYTYYDLDGDGTAELIPLFSDQLEDYFLGLRQQGTQGRPAPLLRARNRRQLRHH
jgi:hypothetical protein